MEWLTNLLGFANQGTSPFGALGGGMGTPGGTSAGPQGAGGGGFPNLNMMGSGNATGMGAPMGGGGLPGLLGKLFGGGQGGSYNGPTGNIGYGTGVGATGPIPAAPMGQQPGLGGGNNQALLSQAMQMLKGPQMQAPPQMQLLSGPRGGGFPNTNLIGRGFSA